MTYYLSIIVIILLKAQYLLIVVIIIIMIKGTMDYKLVLMLCLVIAMAFASPSVNKKAFRV